MEIVFIGTFDVQSEYIIAADPSSNSGERIKVRNGKYHSHCLLKNELNTDGYVFRKRTNRCLTIVNEECTSISILKWERIQHSTHTESGIFGFFDAAYFEKCHSEEIFRDWYLKQVCDINALYNGKIENSGCWLQECDFSRYYIEVAKDHQSEDIVAVRYICEYDRRHECVVHNDKGLKTKLDTTGFTQGVIQTILNEHPYFTETDEANLEKLKFVIKCRLYARASWQIDNDVKELREISMGTLFKSNDIDIPGRLKFIFTQVRNELWETGILSRMYTENLCYTNFCDVVTGETLYIERP